MCVLYRAHVFEEIKLGEGGNEDWIVFTIDREKDRQTMIENPTKMPKYWHHTWEKLKAFQTITFPRIDSLFVTRAEIHKD